MTNTKIEYSNLGPGWDGKIILRQAGDGHRQRLHLRFVTVDASSETAAKKIQAAWRSENLQQSSEKRSNV